MNPLYRNDQLGQYPPSYYAATAAIPPTRPALDGDIKTDLAVIGPLELVVFDVRQRWLSRSVTSLVGVIRSSGVPAWRRFHQRWVTVRSMCSGVPAWTRRLRPHHRR